MEQQPKKKILFVITKSNWGGAQKYVYDLATSLPRDIFDVAVVFGGAGQLAERLTASGIRTISVTSLQRDVSISGDALSFFKLLSLFNKEKPDIIHVNSSKVGGIGALAARILGVPRIIFTCHGWPFNEERALFSLWSIAFFSWLTVVLSHKTITVSARDFTDGQNMPWVKNKMVLVHNGIRKPEFKDAVTARADLVSLARAVGITIEPNDLMVGAMGELHKNKGYEYLIEAFAELLLDHEIPTKLIIMGEGEERKNIEGLIQKFRLEKNVALLGFVKDSPTYLHACNAFTLTSIKEGLPYVVIEAGFAGLPVVATNVGGVKEIIDDMKSGILVQTRKPTDIAQGLNMLLTESEKAKNFGIHLREKVENQFSLENMTRKTISVYEQK